MTEIGPDADLSFQSFIGQDLRGVDLSGANLRRAILDRADLEGANLSGADLRNASMIGTNAMKAAFDNADLRNVKAKKHDLDWPISKMHAWMGRTSGESAVAMQYGGMPTGGMLE